MAKGHLNLVGFLLIYLESYHVSVGENNDRSFKGAVRVRKDCFLTAIPLVSKRTINAFACAHLCLANTFCISVAFCKHGDRTNRGQCHLFNKGIRSVQTTENSPSLVKKNGCTFYQFVEVFEGCRSITCHNGGSCYHDNNRGGFRCACVQYHSGDFCEQSKPIIQYRFTNLHNIGRTGPLSPSGYAGTTLEGKVTLKDGYQKWSVPSTGRYHFDIRGASGGDGKLNMHKGGKGAKVSGYVRLNGATSLVIVVGQKGVSSNAGGGGGGGGTFVFHSNMTIIGIAGGGGGGGGLVTQRDGGGGLANQNGGRYSGRNGQGGSSCSTPGYPIPGGGGGYASNGQCFKGPNCSSIHQCPEGGGSNKTKFLGGQGDANGGFGGGGAGNGSFPGGGGGYSGGGVIANQEGYAEGGSSYVLDKSWDAVASHNIGNGVITITFYG